MNKERNMEIREEGMDTVPVIYQGRDLEQERRKATAKS